MANTDLNLDSNRLLIQQLIAIEENRFNWLDEQFPHLSRERGEVNELLDEYIQALQTLIDKSRNHPQFCQLLPIVIMDSVVEVELLAKKQRRVYRILPFYEDRAEAHDISILSPMGRSLLLKETGAMVRVPAPSGELVYQIHSITMPHNG